MRLSACRVILAPMPKVMVKVYAWTVIWGKMRNCLGRASVRSVLRVDMQRLASRSACCARWGQLRIWRDKGCVWPVIQGPLHPGQDCVSVIDARLAATLVWVEALKHVCSVNQGINVPSSLSLCSSLVRWGKRSPPQAVYNVRSANPARLQI